MFWCLLFYFFNFKKRKSLYIHRKWWKTPTSIHIIILYISPIRAEKIFTISSCRRNNMEDRERRGRGGLKESYTCIQVHAHTRARERKERWGHKSVINNTFYFLTFKQRYVVSCFYLEYEMNMTMAHLRKGTSLGLHYYYWYYSASLYSSFHR